MDAGCGRGCCGFVALVFFLIIVYHVVNIIILGKKAGKIKGTDTTKLNDLLGMKDELAKRPKYLELKGEVNCSEPMRTPFSHFETISYHFKVTQYYTTPGGEDDVDHTKIVHQSRRICPFNLCDGTESVPVILDPYLSTDIDLEEEKEFTSPQYLKDENISYQNVPLNAYDISYEYTENYIPVGGRVYFIGNVKYENNRFVLMPGGGTSFLSDRTDKQLIGKTLAQRAGSIRWLFFATVCFAIGFIGFYGQPEGLASVLRDIVDFTLDVLSEMD